MTSKFTPDRRNQVEEWLGRPLTNEELVDVASLSELSAAQMGVLTILSHLNSLAALIYLRGVVHDVLGDDALALINQIHDTPVQS